MTRVVGAIYGGGRGAHVHMVLIPNLSVMFI